MGQIIHNQHADLYVLTEANLAAETKYKKLFVDNIYTV